MGYGYSDDRKASVRFSSSKTNGFVSQGVRGEISHKSYRIQSTHNFQESHHMCLHFFCVCNNLRLQIICTKIASLNKSNLVVFVFLHSLCDSNELWHFHLNLNLRCVCMCVCVLLSRFSYCVCVCVCVCCSVASVMCVCVCCSIASVMSKSLRPHGLQTASLLCPWDFTGKNTRMGCHAFLQGIFLTQGLSQLLLQADFLPTKPPGKPRSQLIHIKLIFVNYK